MLGAHIHPALKCEDSYSILSGPFPITQQTVVPAHTSAGTGSQLTGKETPEVIQLAGQLEVYAQLASLLQKPLDIGRQPSGEKDFFLAYLQLRRLLKISMFRFIVDDKISGHLQA